MPDAMLPAFAPIAGEWAMVQARLARADEHYATFGRIWADYLDRLPHRLEPTPEDDGTVTVRVRQHAKLPVELSIAFGELLYELRSALDNCLYAVAVLVSGEDPPPDAKRLEWPIRLNPAEWQSQASRYRRLPASITEALEAIQPYQAETPSWNALRILHELARVDRHRSPHGLGIYLTEARLMAVNTEVEVLFLRGGGIVSGGDVIARVRPLVGVELAPSNFDLDLDFTVEVTSIEDSLGPNGVIGRPWGPLDSRLRALSRASREYTEGLFAIAAIQVGQAESRP